MDKKSVSGSCLCGKVTFKIETPLLMFRYCHCSRCRKATGSAHASNIFILPEHFSWISGDENVVRYDLNEARGFATCFCKTCGSPLPHTTKRNEVVVPAGTLDDDPGQLPESNIFWKFRASWSLEPGEMPKFDEYENK
ncbi:MAG: GFA family protein [Deltaproteobacteria bacterium]|nr:GFA family protein [Deltaproteobacteria bacterium]